MKVSTFSGWTTAAVLLLLTALAALLLAPRAVHADTPITVGGGWAAEFTPGALGADSPDGPFTFTSAVPVNVTIVDVGCRGDVFEVRDGATVLGSTSSVTYWACNDPATNDPDYALTQNHGGGFSSGVFALGPGSHSINVNTTFRADNLNAYIRVDAAVEGPHWEVRAKIGGGNIYNQFLPDYTPDTWSTKNVTVYLFCVPGDAPIDLLRADRAVIFKDGQHTYSTKPTDVCIDEDGLAAEPIVDWGPIKVDTKPPTCKVTPSTIYVARNTTATVVWGVDFSDDGSGYLTVIVGVVNSGGSGHALIGATGSPPTSWTIVASMGSSTAGRVTTSFTAYDNAGNTSTCTAVARAK